MGNQNCSCGNSDRKPSQSEHKLFKHFTANPDTWWYGYKLFKLTGIAQGTLYRLLDKFYEKGILELKTEIISSRIRKSYRLDKSHMHCLQKRIENYEIEEAIRDLN